MLYVKLDKDGNIVKYPYVLNHFQLENPDIKISSLSEIETEILEKNYIYLVQFNPPPVLPIDQKLVMANPLLIDGNWQQHWEIRDLTELEIETKTNELALRFRTIRNKLLSDSDWVVIKAFETQTLVPQEWIDYRQTLRDITLQPEFPANVVFPKPLITPTPKLSGTTNLPISYL